MIALLKSTESLKNLQVLERNKSFSEHSTENNTPKPDPKAIKFLEKVDKRHKFIKLYIKIFYLSLKHGYAYASDETLSEALDISLRNVKRYILKLEKLGVIYRITNKKSIPYRRKIYLSDSYNNELKKCLRGTKVAQYSYLHSSDKKYKYTSSKESTGGFKEASLKKEGGPPKVVSPPTKSGKGSWQQKGSLRHQFKTPKNIEIVEQKEKMRFSHNEKVRLSFISESKIHVALEIFKEKIKKGFRPKGRWERYLMGIIDKLLQKEGIQIATPTFYAYLDVEDPERGKNLPGYVPNCIASHENRSTKPNVVNPISIGTNVKYSQSVSLESAQKPPQLFPGEAGSSSIFEAKSDVRREPTPPNAPKNDSKESRIDYLCKKVSRYLKSIGCGNRLVVGRNYIEVDFGPASPSSYIRFDDPDFDRHFDELASRIGMPKNDEVAHL